MSTRAGAGASKGTPKGTRFLSEVQRIISPAAARAECDKVFSSAK